MIRYGIIAAWLFAFGFSAACWCGVFGLFFGWWRFWDE